VQTTRCRAETPARRHPIIPRGVWLAPIITPEGLDIAFAVTSAGVQIAREEHDPADWEAVHDRLVALLDEIDPLPSLRLLA
jgi:hypothetical protein